MQAIIALLVFLSLVTFITALQNKLQPAKVDLQGRLKNVINYDETADIRQAELSRPLSERICSPLLGALSAIASRLLPADILKGLERKVQQAGMIGGFSAKDYLGMKVVFAFGLPFFFYLLFGRDLSPQTALIVAIAGVLGWRLPEMKLENTARSRKASIEKSFPDTLDLLTVSVGAGLGFDGALAKVVEKSEGPVAEEFRRVLQEIKMGKARREALRDFGERTGIDDVKSFTGAIVQADQLGLNIGKTLKVQSEQMRRKRRQRVEEQAMKVPVKMLLPLVAFIFPTIFIVLLGPAMIQIVETLVM
ncbi:type II secretion system F family protein [Dethiobacter alkaliphilus]|uniref:type II secretion system F family protein n=1 Tax=Dethiobacter alkaliphilus TaxID=427926 RepID=UPI002227E3CC|nr:type II secretion system F family protein [Dethiobacter alkaliphilus]MCW3489634.1 type II secretion system F family protein [Dethiobacter alkaliphilus]